MSKQQCMGCMKEYGTKYEVCPHCGYIRGTGPKEAYHLKPGTVLQGKYLVGRTIGHGGFGITYIGYNKVLQQVVAIKEYFPGEFATRTEETNILTIYSGEREEQFLNGVDKFIEEARKLAKFRGKEGIVNIHDSFRENKTAYIVMEYLDGETLEKRLDREGRLNLEEACDIIRSVIGTLEIVHSEDILHRDIKPSNIYLTRDNRVKLMDFGAARYATTTHTKSLSVLVSSGYAPQEQYISKGEQGNWTDVYGCAATFYKMLTGIKPEDAMDRGEKDTLLPPSKHRVKISKSMENAIMNALNLKIEDRTKTVKEFEEQLFSLADVKRNKVKNKKLDIGRWPLWVKLTAGIAAFLVVSFAILLLTGVISVGNLNILDRGSLDEESVYVPNVVNYSLEEAIEKTEEVKLVTQIVGKTNSDYIPKDMVLSQGIEDGEVVKIGTVLDITVSAGGEMVYMPDLTGMTEEKLQETLDELGVYYQTKEEESFVAKGCVTGQNLGEGLAIEKGSTVVITISTGMAGVDESQSTTVPKLVGLSWDEALDKSKQAKLYVYKQASEYSNEYPKGQIISQSIDEATQAKQGSEIGVVVSLGIKKTRVPDLQYKSLEEAKALLADANLLIDVQYENSNVVAKDHIIRQSVAYGTEVEINSTVTVWISLGNPSVESIPVPGSSETTDTPDPTTESRRDTDSNQGTVTTEQNTTESKKENTTESTTQQATTEAAAHNQTATNDVSLPNLVGKKESEAKKLIEGSGLTVGSITYKHDENGSNGMVISQDLAAGTKVSKNTKVNLVVCNNEQYTEYRYRTKTTKTVTNQTLDQGTLIDSKESFSAWSAETTNPIVADDYTEVSTRTETYYLDNPGAPLPVPTSSISTTNRSYRADVAWVQTFLNSYYGPLLNVDGIYGGLTLYYVGVFQREYQLVDDKSVGPSTAQVMLQVWKNITATSTTYYKYRTKTVVNTYEIWSDWSSWSTSYVEEADDKEVETRMIYKY